MQRWWRVWAAVIVLMTVSYQGWEMILGSGRPMLQGVDDSLYYFWARSAVVDGDWDFANDLAEAPTMTEGMRAQLQAAPRTELGRVPNKYAVGWGIVSLPLVALAHGWVKVTGGTADGWQPAYFVVLWAGHLAIGVLGLWLARWVLRRFWPAEAAEWGLGVGWLASPLVFYMGARISMVHGLAFTLVAALWAVALRLREGARGLGWWALLGGVAGLLAITRPTLVLYGLFPLVVVAERIRRTGWRAVAGGVSVAGAAAVLVGLVQLWAWRCVYGEWVVYSYGGEGFAWADPQVAQVLASPRHGWFYWHPWMAVGIGAAGWWAWRRTLPATWVLTVAAVIYVNAAWHCWWFGSSFGNRAFEGATLVVMAGLAGLWAATETRPAWRRGLRLAAGAAVALNLAWLVAFMGGWISREGAVTYADLARAWWERS